MEMLRNLKVLIFSLALSMAVIAISIICYETFKMYTEMPEDIIKRNAIKKPVKFFQIGFSKCGTKSLVDFFNRNHVTSIHHDGGNLALSMHANYEKGVPLLPDMYSGYYGFFDMERLYDKPLISIPKLLFKEIDKQYPGSKFILNTRNKKAWLKSKAIHPAYHHKMRWLQLHAQFLNKDQDEVLAIWSKEWDDHYNAVLDHFKDRPNDLLIFDIEKDDPKKLCEFFEENFRLDPSFYEHKNKSEIRDKEMIIDY